MMNPLHSPESINTYFIEQIKDYAIFAMDPQGIITTWNIGCERIKKYKEEEVVGQFYGILHPEEYQQAGIPQQEIAIALQQGSYEKEDWRRRKDGSLFWAFVTLTPIYDKEGTHVGFTKITGDITRQKELQDKLAERQQNVLERKNKELQKTNLDLDTFIYTASHDLRSPISNIEGLMRILQEDLQEIDSLKPQTQEVITRIMDSVERFKSTIEHLTELSKVQQNYTEEAPDILTVQEVYDSIMADLEYSTTKSTCFMQTDFQVAQLSFSRKNFHSIMYNLINNACKYHSPERSCIVEVHTRLEEPYVVLQVKDNGLGLNEHQQEQLFTMFKRFHNHVAGSGIGLYMVKRLVENAGGKIEVKSQEGVGTEFKVYFKAKL